MVLVFVLLGIWAIVTIPMALVLLLDDKPRRPARPPAPVITLGERGHGPHHHRPAA